MSDEKARGDSKSDITAEVKKLALTDGETPVENGALTPTVRKARKDKISAKEKRDCEGTGQLQLFKRVDFIVPILSNPSNKVV